MKSKYLKNPYNQLISEYFIFCLFFMFKKGLFQQHQRGLH